MFLVAYQLPPNERLTETFATLGEGRSRACALLAEHGESLAIDIRMGTMVLIGAVEIRQWCAGRPPP